jgi:hypothetical protein
MGRGAKLTAGGIDMPEQFENREATKLGGETAPDATAEERMERVAEKAAEKSTKTEKRYDADHGIFSK